MDGRQKSRMEEVEKGKGKRKGAKGRGTREERYIMRGREGKGQEEEGREGKGVN